MLDEAVIFFHSTPKQIPNMIRSLSVQKSLSFSDEDHLPLGRKHSLALYITVQTQGKFIPQVLIDNGSTINVCPLKTAKRLGIRESELSPFVVTVRAYDNMRKVVLGFVRFDLSVRPENFLANFQIIDIPSSFNFLLGRAWLHDLGALSSSLHQNIRIPFREGIITIQGDPERTLSDLDLSVLGIGSQSIQLGGFSCEPQVEALTTQKIEYMFPNNALGLSAKIRSILRMIKYLPRASLGMGQQGLL